jgi:hypothetical protein
MALVALASGIVALATIRRKDFAAQQDPPDQQARIVRESYQPATAAPPRTGK